MIVTLVAVVMCMLAVSGLHQMLTGQGDGLAEIATMSLLAVPMAVVGGSPIIAAVCGLVAGVHLPRLAQRIYWKLTGVVRVDMVVTRRMPDPDGEATP